MSRDSIISRMLAYATVFACGLLLQPAVSPAANSPQPVLVELFTSEGCSSCPPADRLLAELDRKQPVSGATVIVLSEHVDYWNYLGWRDPYSSSRWSERQSDYGRHFRLDSVYTPQMVVNGTHEVNGSDASAVRKAIEESTMSPALPISISSIDRANSTLSITVSAAAGPGASLYAAIADDADRSSVQRGENEGRTLDHVAVLRSLEMVASLQTPLTDKPLKISLPSGSLNRHLRLILFVQDEKSGHVLGVAEREF
jgi:hypothetical protein